MPKEEEPLTKKEFLKMIDMMLDTYKSQEDFAKAMNECTEEVNIDFDSDNDVYYKVYIPHTGKSSVYVHFKSAGAHDAISTSLDIVKDKLPRLMLFTMEEIVDLGLELEDKELFLGGVE